MFGVLPDFHWKAQNLASEAPPELTEPGTAFEPPRRVVLHMVVDFGPSLQTTLPWSVPAPVLASARPTHVHKLLERVLEMPHVTVADPTNRPVCVGV